MRQWITQIAIPLSIRTILIFASGVALATVGGVLIEVPLMLALVKFCTRTTHWFKTEAVTIE